MTSPTVPASWTPEQTAAVAAFRDGLNSTDVVKMREEMGKAPPAEYPKGVQLKAVEIPRVAVPELEEKVDGTVKAEWLEPENKTGDEPVLIYVHGGGYCIMSPQSHRVR